MAGKEEADMQFENCVPRIKSVAEYRFANHS